MADSNHLLLEPCSSISAESERDIEEKSHTSHVDRNNKDLSSNSEKITISDKISKSKLFKRRNIRNILERDRLSAATLNAQRKEQERLNRVSLLSDDAQCHSSEVQQQTTTTTTLCLEEAERDELLKRYEIWKKFSNERKQLFDNDVVTLSSDEDDISKAKRPCNNFDRKISTSDNGYDSEIICVESDDDGNHMPEASTSQQADDADEDSQNVPDVNGKMLVNVGHPQNDPDIFILDHLAKIIKPHQLGGIRFMYNNIIESLIDFEEKSGFGCVLAHSMGLGKTLQVVTFVDILYRHTTGKRILILVPINTLQNWVNEFEHWLPVNGEDIPRRSFDVFCLDEKAKTTIQRLSIVENWYTKMGVLLMGYEMFRLLANKDLSKNKKKQSMINVQNCKPNVHSIHEQQAPADDLRRFLINPGPDLIVCDEGHRIKTMQTHISKTLLQIKTQRRIVLTGYPLQNNMFEYWCMVNFVRPNYLGTKHEFSNMFERPIKNGQCADSTPNDARLMRYRVHVLTNLLKGFVQRRCHSVLTHNLPPKHEFVVYLRKSPIQQTLYRRFVAYCRGEIADSGSSFNPLRTFAVCCKIWNHPDVLYDTVRSRMLDNDLDIMEMSSSTDFVSDNGRMPKNFQWELPMNRLEREGSMDYRWAEDVFADYIPGNISNGYKVLLSMSIIERSVLIGDKVLLFSQSLLTLNLIESFLNAVYVPGTMERWRKNEFYFRLDGSTPSGDRHHLINRFNKNANVHLFLISTRAGSLGINLVSANRVIIFDASWNPCHDSQAVCRIYRYGQIKPTFVYRLIMDNSMEKTIFNRQVGKKGMSDRIVDDKPVEAQVYSNDLLNLLQYKEEIDINQTPVDTQAINFKDTLLSDICNVYKDCLAQQPIHHESLFLNRSDQVLNAREKREAKRNYEREKKALSASSSETSILNRDRPILSADLSFRRPMLPLKCTPIPMNIRPVNDNTLFRNQTFPPMVLDTTKIAPVVRRVSAPFTLTLPSPYVPGTEGLVMVNEPIDILDPRFVGFLCIRTSNGNILDARNSVFERLVSQIVNNQSNTDQQRPFFGTNFSQPVEITLSSDEDA